MREYHNSKKGGGNPGNRSQYSSVSLRDKASQRGSTSGTGDGEIISMQ